MKEHLQDKANRSIVFGRRKDKDGGEEDASWSELQISAVFRQKIEDGRRWVIQWAWGKKFCNARLGPRTNGRRQIEEGDGTSFMVIGGDSVHHTYGGYWIYFVGNSLWTPIQATLLGTRRAAGHLGMYCFFC
ncbi:hypothetical protein BDK51DRAFT_32852, partial [Blyttiomyces helicus]